MPEASRSNLYIMEILTLVMLYDNLLRNRETIGTKCTIRVFVRKAHIEMANTHKLHPSSVQYTQVIL